MCRKCVSWSRCGLAGSMFSKLSKKISRIQTRLILDVPLRPWSPVQTCCFEDSLQCRSPQTDAYADVLRDRGLYVTQYHRTALPHRGLQRIDTIRSHALKGGVADRCKCSLMNDWDIPQRVRPRAVVQGRQIVKGRVESTMSKWKWGRGGVRCE